MSEPDRNALKEAIWAISINGLMPAFEDLKKVRESAGRQLPELDRKQLYEDFTVVL
jgi:hypothetical protein